MLHLSNYNDNVLIFYKIYQEVENKIKTKLNEKLILYICEYLKKGVPILTTCQAVGIAESTYYDWIKRGQGCHNERSQEDIYVKFVEEVEKAHHRRLRRFVSGFWDDM